MIKTNYDIWDIMGAGTGLDLGEVNILHLPTIVENSKGETVIRGFYGMSLGVKLKVEVSADFLLDILTTAEPMPLDPIRTVIPPPDISKCRKAVKQVDNTNWVPARSPVVMLLVGNVLSDVVNPDDDYTLIMAKKFYPLAIH